MTGIHIAQLVNDVCLIFVIFFSLWLLLFSLIECERGSFSHLSVSQIINSLIKVSLLFLPAAALNDEWLDQWISSSFQLQTSQPTEAEVTSLCLVSEFDVLCAVYLSVCC